MSRPSFAASYAAALAAYVDDRTERRLTAAYDLGRAAVEQGLGVLDVAAAHNDALLQVAGETDDLVAVTQLSGEFLIESLATFEMVQRGATEAWRAAWEERRRARMVRELSAVLADAEVASAADESAQEVAQLVVEMLREMAGAAEAHVTFRGPSSTTVKATAAQPEGDTSEITQPGRHPREDAPVDQDVIAVPIRSIHGAHYGQIEVIGPVGAAFRSDDHATVRQVADLAAAWLDRTIRARSS